MSVAVPSPPEATPSQTPPARRRRASWLLLFVPVLLALLLLLIPFWIWQQNGGGSGSSGTTAANLATKQLAGRLHFTESRMRFGLRDALDFYRMGFAHDGQFGLLKRSAPSESRGFRIYDGSVSTLRDGVSYQKHGEHAALILPTNSTQISGSRGAGGGGTTIMRGGKVIRTIGTYGIYITTTPGASSSGLGSSYSGVSSGGTRFGVGSSATPPGAKRYHVGNMTITGENIEVIPIPDALTNKQIVANGANVNAQDPITRDSSGAMPPPQIPMVAGMGSPAPIISSGSRAAFLHTKPVSAWAWNDWINPMLWYDWSQAQGSGAFQKNTLLIAAIRSGNMENVRLLLDNGARVDRRGAWRMTPLHEAVRLGQPEMVKILLTKSADKTAKDAYMKKTPAEWADMEIAEYERARLDCQRKIAAVPPTKRTPITTTKIIPNRTSPALLAHLSPADRKRASRPGFSRSMTTPAIYQEVMAEKVLAERIMLLKQVRALL